MRKTAFLILPFLILFSCSKKSELSKSFNCNSVEFKNTETVIDFNKNFRLSIPVSWKTELYYDKFTSEIFTADTTKQLSETFILDSSYNLGAVNFNSDFLAKNDSVATSKNYKIIKSETTTFQNKECYWYLLKGTKNNFPYHQYNFTLKLSENTYFNSYVEIYGEELIDERICQAISIIDGIEFLQ